MSDTVQRAFALAQAGRLGDAQAVCEAVLARHPRNFDALHLLGRLHASAADYPVAIALVQRSLDFMPFHGPLWHTLGVLFELGGRPAPQACGAYQRCLALEPRHAEAAEALARLLGRQGLWAQLLQFGDDTLRRGLRLRGLSVLRGIALQALDRPADAQAAFTDAERHDPGLLAPRYQHACALLSQGRFEEGWARYEFRREAGPRFGQGFASPPLPRWFGQPLRGKTILVHREQSLAAQVLLASMLPDLQARGARVVLDVDVPLRSLLSAAWPSIALADPAAPMQFDYEIPMGSLGSLLRPNTQAFARKPYLRVSPARRKAWAARLGGAVRRYRVGIVAACTQPAWQGVVPFDAAQDSVPLADFAALAQPGVELVYLGNDAPPGDLPFALRAFPGQLGDLADVAALATQLDAVVGVDTAELHVAAAMGCPVRVLASHSPAWWWGCGDAPSPWYRDAWRVRHGGAGWPAAVQAAAQALCRQFDSSKVA